MARAPTHRRADPQLLELMAGFGPLLDEELDLEYGSPLHEE